jgi:hypothetical protein
VHRYRPAGAALRLLTDRSPELLIAGPAGTGKSRAMLEKLLIVLTARPEVKILLLRKTAVSLTSTTLATWRETVAAEMIHGRGCKWYGGSSERPAGYVFSNGSFLAVGGMDKPEKVMSSEYDIIAVDEATELIPTDWELASSRLRNGRLSYHQIVGACNPAGPNHWLKKRCDTGACALLTSRHEDNPRYYDDAGAQTTEGAQYLARLDRLTGVRRLRLAHGIWAAAEGVVYEDWDDAVHLVDPRPIPAEWRRVWAVDFGYTHPMVLQCWAVDPDGRALLYREFVRTQSLVEDFARWVLRTITGSTVPRQGTWTEPRPSRIVCDHDAEGRETLEKYLGLPCTPAHKAVSEGIQAVQARLVAAGDGRPRLTVARDALVDRDPRLDDARAPIGMAEEIGGYVWDTTGGGTLRETPTKILDDAMDCARYAIASLDLGGRNRIRYLE